MTEHQPTPVHSEADVRALTIEIVLDIAPAAHDADGRSRLVDDLEYTSLALLELAFTLEDELDLPPIDEETARGIVTVGDVVAHVINGLRGEDRLGM